MTPDTDPVGEPPAGEPPAGSTGAEPGPLAAADAQPGATALGRDWLALTIGLLAVVLGAVWTLQGLDLLTTRSFMQGVTVWAVIGPLVAVAGLVLIIVALRARRRR